MRQKLKYTIFTFYLLTSAFFTYELIYVMCLPPDGIRIFWHFSVVLFLAILTTIKRSVFNSPRLSKKIVHETGEYYIYHLQSRDNSNGEYIIYKDFILYKTILFEIADWDIDNKQTLLNKVKSKLDEKYNEKLIMKEKERRKQLALKQKRSILDSWDGYTSKQTMRDDKISKII